MKKNQVMKDRFDAQEKPGILLKEWVEAFVSVHGEKGMIAAAWYIASVFRRIIINKTGGFPHLFLCGPPSSGKALMGNSIYCMFEHQGPELVPFSLEKMETRHFLESVGDPHSMLSWYQDYSPDINPTKIEQLKNCFWGIGSYATHGTIDSDNSYVVKPAYPSIMITGEHPPIEDPVLFNRLIFLPLEKKEDKSIDRGAASRLRYMEQNQHGLRITKDLMEYRAVVAKDMLSCAEEAKKEMGHILNDLAFIDHRIISNHAVLLSVILILETHGLKTGLNSPEFGAALLRNCIDQTHELHFQSIDPFSNI